jgi:hypothetical protein
MTTLGGAAGSIVSASGAGRTAGRSIIGSWGKARSFAAEAGNAMSVGGFCCGAAHATITAMHASKGIAALPAAGKIDAVAVAAPTVSARGIYPNLQGLLLQAARIILVVGGFAYSQYRATRKSSQA